MQIIELIPNFSEGRKPEVIDQLVTVAQSVAGVSLLDYSSDSDHHRSVFTLLGSPEAIIEVGVKLARQAQALIDLRQHEGAHPRMGATDVLPLVPILNITLEETIEIANRLGQAIGEELTIPVYLYGEAASSEERRNLSNIRKGQFEGMAAKIQSEGWRPDYGPQQLHPSAGATAVGVRRPLIAFNINLATDNLAIAKSIAQIIRSSNGGFKDVKAIGLTLEEEDCVQVSINMTDYQQTPLYRVLETVRMEAQRYGVAIKETEIIGLAPSQALVDSAMYYLQLKEFDGHKQIIEQQLIEELSKEVKETK